jgi:transcriptional regulator with XRE-family HTH domain
MGMGFSRNTTELPMKDKFVRVDWRLIKPARKSRGITQGQLASAIGKSQVAISALEKGKIRISMELAESLFQIFGSEVLATEETNILREQVKRRLDNVDDDFIKWLSETLNILKA